MKEKLGRFFFLLDDSKESIKKTSQNIGLNTKLSQSLKVSESIEKNTYKTIKLEGIRIISKQNTCKRWAHMGIQ